MDIAVLQRVLAILRADTAVASFVGTRIFDNPPHADGVPEVASPYISLGPHDTTSDEADCLDIQELNFQVDVWSWGGGESYSRVQAGKIANAVRDALHRRVETVDGSEVEIAHIVTRHQRHDGEINHAVITMRAFIG